MDSNIYYSPEDFGLSTIGDVDTAGSYEFTMLVVWVRKEDGALFWATDSGCSCPSPFEGIASVDDLTAITDASAFAREARAWIREQYSVGVEDREALERIIRSVQRRMRALAVTA